MIQFILNNEVIRTTVHSGITLLDFIRDHKQLKGTKIGCREGDCGACTVLIGTLHGDKVSYQSITSCISPLGNANSKHIVTVEGINLLSNLNTVQQAMTDQYATQCGFCTPGFVVSMTGYAMNSHGKSPSTCNDAISGNICRCTGYKSIEKAGLIIERKLKERDGNASIAWLINEGFIPDYFESIPKRLSNIQSKSSVSNGVVVANGTDLYVRKADVLAESDVNLIADSNNLKGLTIKDQICTLGSNTTVTELLDDKRLIEIFPKLKSFLKLVSSEQIRNMGTIGGNMVNASPIGDMTIFFLALDADLIIMDDSKMERQMPLREFYKGYKKFDLQEGEIVKSISFNIVAQDEFFNFEKVSKRTHLDIASVNTAAKFTVSDKVIENVHLSMGGVAPIPLYLSKTRTFLIGKSIDAHMLQEAAQILQSEIAPISDVRGSSDYKRLLAQQLFYSHFIELFPSIIQLETLIA